MCSTKNHKSHKGTTRFLLATPGLSQSIVSLPLGALFGAVGGHKC